MRVSRPPPSPDSPKWGLCCSASPQSSLLLLLLLFFFFFFFFFFFLLPLVSIFTVWGGRGGWGRGRGRGAASPPLSGRARRWERRGNRYLLQGPSGVLVLCWGIHVGLLLAAHFAYSRRLVLVNLRDLVCVLLTGIHPGRRGQAEVVLWVVENVKVWSRVRANSNAANLIKKHPRTLDRDGTMWSLKENTTSRDYNSSSFNINDIMGWIPSSSRGILGGFSRIGCNIVNED